MHNYERMAYLGRIRRAIPLGWMPTAVTFSDSPGRPRNLSATHETEESNRPFMVCIVWIHSLSNSGVCLVCRTYVETLNDESMCRLGIKYFKYFETQRQKATTVNVPRADQ